MYYTADVVRDYEAGNAHLDDEAAASVAAAWSHLDDIYYIDDYAPEDRIGIIADDATNAAYAVAAGDVTVKELCAQLRQLDAEWQETAWPPSTSTQPTTNHQPRPLRPSQGAGTLPVTRERTGT